MNTPLFQNGIEYERRAAARLRRAGYRVQWNENHAPHDPDLIVRPSIRIEVKGSKLRKVAKKCRGYCFTIFRRGVSSPIEEELVLLVCVTPRRAVPFIIPTASLGDIHHITIPNPDPRKYHGRWALYREAWSILDEHGPERRTR